MTVSMRVMSAGDGYKYLLRTVAAADGDRSLSTPLTRYYAEKGSPPGAWMGSGLPALGGGQLVVGAQVSEAQLQLLVRMGRDPLTGEPLGRAYPAYASVSERVEARTADIDPHLDDEAKAEEVARIEAEENERGTRRAVAGFDYTFSIPKSASVLWAVADAGTQALIADAHHAAVAEVVAFIEREVATTRVGATSPDGAAAQVDVTGVIATAFDHYDSRAGDPHLHTHVVISNKVQTAQDGKWRSLDGRPMHAAVVALSELHEAVFADHMTRTFGVEWEPRDMGRDRNPAWAITTVPEELVAEFSTRARQIDEEKNRLIDAYVAQHGKQPSAATILKLRAQATLATRPEKEVHSLAELTEDWRERASTVLGSDATGWAREVTAAPETPPAVLRADDVTLDLIAEVGQMVVWEVGEKRSTWRRWNLYAEASRQLMGWRFTTMEDREAITGMVVDAAEQASLRLTPPELASSPVVFQRDDGTSRFRPAHSTVFSSEDLLNAEDRLLQRSRASTGPTVALETVERITTRADQHGRLLSDEQTAALAAIAVSGRVVDVLVGAAGAGKTTAMNALRRAWEAEHGRRSVVGLAPSAVAAAVLAEDLGIATENTAKWWTNHTLHGTTFTAGQLVIIDEASLAGTHSLDRITALAEQAGAKVLLVGDYAQLHSVDAGGAFNLLVNDRDDAPELTDIHRFTHVWEKTASLSLRHGRTEIIDTYRAHDRIQGGDEEAMIDAAYAAWRADQQDGRATVLVTDSNESVFALNQRARIDLILDGTVNALREVELHDGTRAAVGDSVITRHNDRRLRAGRSWVRNGDRWTVTGVRDDGSLTLRRAGQKRGGTVVLPHRLRGRTPRPGLRRHFVPGTRDHSRPLPRPGRRGHDPGEPVRCPHPRPRGEHGLRRHRQARRHPRRTTPRRQHRSHRQIRPVRGPPARRCRALRARDHHCRKTPGGPSPNSPPSTRPSLPQLNTIAGRASSACPGSPRTRQSPRSAHPPSAPSPPRCAAPRPTITTSERCCHASWRHAGSATPTTSPPSCTTASPRPPPDPPGPGAPARRRS